MSSKSLLRITFAFVSLLFSAYPVVAENPSGFRDIRILPTRDVEAEARGELRNDAKEAARILRVELLVNSIRQAKSAGVASNALSRSLQYARMISLWKICMASEEVRKLVAEIDFDLAQSHMVLEQLNTRKNMTLAMITTANFMQGGTLGTIKQATGLHHGFPRSARQEIGMTGFSTGMVLAMSTLLVPSFISERIPSSPGVLIRILDPKYTPAELDRGYLWTFINSPVPGSGSALTRREILLKHWEAFLGINAADREYMRKLGNTPTESEDLDQDIKIVSKRNALLFDMKTHFEEFDASLCELQKGISFN